MIGVKYDPTAKEDEIIERVIQAENSESGQEEQLMHYTNREKAFSLFSMLVDHPWLRTHPKAWWSAIIFQVVNVFMILLSIIVFIIGTEPRFWAIDSLGSIGLFVVESVTIAFFIFDYLVRFFTCPSKTRFAIQALNIIDLLVILPYFVEIGVEVGGVQGSQVGVLAVIKLLRLFRVLRLLKLGKYSNVIVVLGHAFRKSWEGPLMLIVLLAVAIVLFSSFIFFAEQSQSTFNEQLELWIYDDGTVSGFQSVADSFWWCIVTMTFVGYGDLVPKTPVGKFVAAMTMFSGMLVLIFPLTVIGITFAREYNKYRLQRRAGRLQHMSAREVLNQVHKLAADINETLKNAEKKQRTLGLLLYKLSRNLEEVEGGNETRHIDAMGGAFQMVELDEYSSSSDDSIH